VVSGSNVIKTSSKNQFGGNIYNGQIGSSGGFSTSTTRITNVQATQDNSFYLKAGTYTLSINNLDSCTLLTKNNNYQIIDNFADSWRNLPFTFTLTADGYVYITARKNNNATLNPKNYNIQVQTGTTATIYEPHQGKELPLDLGSVELCKIGNYQDYFYKSGSKWYLYKKIKKRVFNGSESWATAKNTSPYVNNLYIADYLRVEENIIIDTHFQSVINGTYGSMTDGQIKFRYYSDTSNLLYICTTVAQTLADFKTWLSNNNVTIYYVLKEDIITEITDTTLINQLEAIYNAPLYKQTNITQTNNDLPMVLDITACKDNINGIKAFIRNSDIRE